MGQKLDQNTSQPDKNKMVRTGGYENQKMISQGLVIWAAAPMTSARKAGPYCVGRVRPR